MYKVGDKVKYNGKQYGIMGCIGTVMATKEDNEYPDYKLRSDEVLVDFGYEDDNEYVVRLKSLESVGDKVTAHDKLIAMGWEYREDENSYNKNDSDWIEVSKNGYAIYHVIGIGETHPYLINLELSRILTQLLEEVKE